MYTNIVVIEMTAEINQLRYKRTEFVLTKIENKIEYGVLINPADEWASIYPVSLDLG